MQPFWERVDDSDPQACWPWLAGCTAKGYGKVYDGKVALYAHRVAYELAVGPIPAGLCVCHDCDNPRCCNPAHLWLGTVGDNNQDRWSKGRDVHHGLPGERNPQAKLTAAQVADIRGRVGTVSQAQLAREYEVSRSLVCKIVKGRLW